MALPGQATSMGFFPDVHEKQSNLSNTGQRKVYVCPKQGCGLNFLEYAGIKRVGPRGSGLAYCPSHNPNSQKEGSNDGSASAVSTPSQ
jgi:hypothetical protein